MARFNKFARASAISPGKQVDTALQDASPLFKLPYEIRQMIWQMVLGNMTLHLVSRFDPKSKHDILSYVKCRFPQHRQLCDLSCWRYWDMENPMYGNEIDSPEFASFQLLSPLLACRQMYVPNICKLSAPAYKPRYSEAAHHLYSSNNFDSSNGKCIISLPQIMTTLRLQQIHTVTMKCHIFLYFSDRHVIGQPPTGRFAYRSPGIWPAFERMRGLRHLRIEFLVYDPIKVNLSTGHPMLFEGLLAPIRLLTNPPADFELVMPFPFDEEDGQWNDLPCRVTRGEPVVRSYR